MWYEKWATCMDSWECKQFMANRSLGLAICCLQPNPHESPTVGLVSYSPTVKLKQLSARGTPLLWVNTWFVKHKVLKPLCPNKFWLVVVCYKCVMWVQVSGGVRREDRQQGDTARAVEVTTQFVNARFGEDINQISKIRSVRGHKLLGQLPSPTQKSN